MKILVIPDLHIPYTNMDLLKEVHTFAKRYKPDEIIQLGDMFDFYNLSFYIKATKAESPEIEMNRCKAQVKQVAKMFPNLTIIKGNHENRLARRANDAGIHPGFIKNIMDVMEAPKGWKYYDKKDYIERDGIIYTHGFMTKPEDHSEYFNAPVVVGHLHSKMGINYRTRKDRTIFSMCPGCIVDIDSLVFQYGPLKKYNNISLGFGVVDNCVPHVIPLLDLQNGMNQPLKIKTYKKLTDFTGPTAKPKPKKLKSAKKKR